MHGADSTASLAPSEDPRPRHSLLLSQPKWEPLGIICSLPACFHTSLPLGDALLEAWGPRPRRVPSVPAVLVAVSSHGATLGRSSPAAARAAHGLTR